MRDLPPLMTHQANPGPFMQSPLLKVRYWFMGRVIKPHIFNMPQHILKK